MPELIYLERAARDFPLARDVLAAWPDCPVQEVDDCRRLRPDGADPDEAARDAKRSLALAVRQGPFVKPFGQGECDAEREFAIVHAANCPFDCDYCFLQGYFDHAVSTLFVNLGDLCCELAAHLAQHGSDRPRYHAGEFSDALVFDELTGLTRRLAPLFAKRSGAVLELRTKAAAMPPAGLASLPNVVPSWTLTPAAAARAMESGAPAPAARIRAARAWQDAGFRVGLRFDPIVRLPGWEAAYAGLIDQIAAALDPGRIESVVIACMRFSPALAEAARERGRTRIFMDEFVPCADGKMRYFRPIREAMYGAIARLVRERLHDAPVELCMETACVRRRLRAALLTSSAPFCEHNISSVYGEP